MKAVTINHRGASVRSIRERMRAAMAEKYLTIASTGAVMAYAGAVANVDAITFTGAFIALLAINPNKKGENND